MASEVTRRRRQTPTQARAARRERRNRRTRLKRILALVAVGGVSGLFLIALFIPQSFGGGERDLPDGPGVKQEDQGREHIPEGGSHAPYNTIPPTSGWHYDRWASWGIKSEPLPSELFIHNMEHGGVILHYNCPDGCSDEVKQMEEIVRRTDETILMPNPDMESRFALTAWNWLLTMEEYDDALARDFVGNHLNSPNAPEWPSR
ncbi:MAG: DUF3105 domain-containing protein [Chloroflexota bacterium]|nr:DUF3105 domain-containing protein [Chloroflexota bacterium]